MPHPWPKKARPFLSRPSQVFLAWVLFVAVFLIGGSILFKALFVRAAGPGNVVGWGWNPYFGWISLSGANFDPLPSPNYGVKALAGQITGFAWNEWGAAASEGYYICFGSTCADPAYSLSYLSPPGTPIDTIPSASYDPTTGRVSGWARFVGWSDDDGAWIKLDDGLTAPPHQFGFKIYQKMDGNAPFNPAQWTFGDGPIEPPLAPPPAPPTYDPLKNYSWNGGLGWILWQPVKNNCYCTPWTSFACVPSTPPSDPPTGNATQNRDCVIPSAACQETMADNFSTRLEDCGNFIDDNCNGCIDSIESFCGGKEHYPTDLPDDPKCNDFLSDGITDRDNDCDGFANCRDTDCCGTAFCPASVPSPSIGDSLDGTDCGIVKLTLVSGCGDSPDPGICSIYRSVRANGCEACFEEIGACGVHFNQTAPDCSCTVVASEQLNDTYSDDTVIPRTDYYYWVAALDGTTLSEAVTAQGRTNCFSGSGSHE